MTATGNEAVKLSQLRTALTGAGGGGFSEIAADIPAGGIVTAEGWTIANEKDFTIGVFGFATEKTLFLTAMQNKQYTVNSLSGPVLQITKDGAGVYNGENKGCGAFTDNFSVARLSDPNRYTIEGINNTSSNFLIMAGVLMLSNDYA